MPAPSHRLSGTRLHRIWKAMRTRCNNTKPYYKYWNGKGIKVCEEWNDFLTFRNWAISHGYTNSLTLDRIDGDKNYQPSNCRWATPAEQNRNHKKQIIYKGELSSDATKRLGGKGKNLVAQRIRILGWSYKKAFTTPVDNSRKKNATIVK